MRSDLPVGAFKLSPAVSFAHGDEALKDAAPSAREVNKLAIAPRLSSPVDLGDGRRVEPFVSLDRQLTLDQPVDGQPPSRPTTAT